MSRNNDVSLLMLNDYDDSHDDDDLQQYSTSATPSTPKEKIIYAGKRFAKHFVSQFKPREIMKSIKSHPYLLLSLVVASIVLIGIGVYGIPYSSPENIFSVWTFLIMAHFIQAIAGHRVTQRTSCKKMVESSFPFFCLRALFFVLV